LTKYAVPAVANVGFMTPARPDPNFRVGQRVSREDAEELGTVIETGDMIKVKWDRGRTSYYHRNKPANVKPAEPKNSKVLS
jgi:hypothetical protein